MASKQQRDAERRRLQRQSQRRQAAEARRKRLNIIVSVLAVIVLVGGVITLVISTSGSDDQPVAEPTATSSAPTSPSSSPSSSAAKAAYPCTWTKGGTASKQVSVPSTTTPPKTGTATVKVATNRGDLTFALDRAKAPCAAASFVSLTQQKYYDSTPCHRLTSGGLNVLQCGDPSGSGSGGPGYSFADELTGKETYGRGVLAMANSGPNTNGSQFFVVYKDSQLGPQYTVFGRVTGGLNVLDQIAAKGVKGGGADGPPAETVTLTKLTAS